MTRILRAFAWMRWRIFVNSLEKSGARDAVERASLAIEHVGPLLLLAALVPSALALAGTAGYAGFQLATGVEHSIPFQMVRFVVLVATALALIGPIVLPAADRTNPIRLLLLPIPRRTLYVAQAAGALADPWILLLVPMMAALPIGMLAGGARASVLMASAAGALVIVTVTAASALTTTLMHLLLRDRRRGELIALACVLLLPILSIVPAAMESSTRTSASDTRAPQATVDDQRTPPWLLAVAWRAFGFVPSELYTTAVASAARRDVRQAAGAAAMLAALAAAVHGVGFLLFGRVLASPVSAGAQRTASMAGLWERVLPGLSPGTSAVALAQLRLALRTPRGRAILLSPLLMLAFFGVLVLTSNELPFGSFAVHGGPAIAIFGSAIALLSIVPIAMNQFAVDGAGLTLALLSPLSTRQLLAGKAVGNGLIAAPTALLCMALAAAVFGGGSIAFWLGLVLSVFATLALVSPVAAIVSALLPRTVDMNSIGRGSNAHGLAALLGFGAFAAAAAPCVALTLGATHLLGQPRLAPPLLLVWTAASVLLSHLTFRLAARIFDTRRENLAMLL